MRFAFCVLLLAGCGETGMVDPDMGMSHVDGGPPEAELGTGFDSFMPLVDGQDLPLHAGCQGGYHVWGAVRARHLDPHSPVLDFTMTGMLDGGIGDVLYMPIHVRSTLTPEGTSDWFDGYAYTLRVVTPEAVLDRDVQLSVTVTDRTGLQATDTRRVHVVAGESACTVDAAVFDALDAGSAD